MVAALVNFLAEDPLQDQDAVSIVVLMAIGLEIARRVTGRTSVIAVGNEDILKGIARTVPKN